MARNNDMNALDALLGLGILGAMGDVAKQKVMTEDEILKKGAVSAWKLYHSYIDVGFESEQAFELLKLVLTAK